MALPGTLAEDQPASPLGKVPGPSPMGSPMLFNEKSQDDSPLPSPRISRVPSRKPVPVQERSGTASSTPSLYDKPLPQRWESPPQEQPPTPPIHVNSTPLDSLSDQEAASQSAAPGPIKPASEIDPASEFVLVDLPQQHSRSASEQTDTPELDDLDESQGPMPQTHVTAFRERPRISSAENVHQAQAGIISSSEPQRATSLGSQQSFPARNSSYGSIEHITRQAKTLPQLQYHHQQLIEDSMVQPVDQRDFRGLPQRSGSNSPASSVTGFTAENMPPPPPPPPPPRRLLTPANNPYGRHSLARPSSAYSTLSLPDAVKGRSSPSNNPGSPGFRRVVSGQSPDSRRASYVDLLNVPYPQPPPTTGSFNNSHLRTAVGSNASLLSHKQTLEMYRANAKKTNDPSIQYEFAVFMIGAAQEVSDGTADPATMDGGGDRSPRPNRDLDSPYVDNSTPAASKAELLREARNILQKLSDRSYPFAQYYLADGYASGLFSKGKEDYDKAFPLFVSAGKHGHAEAGYRAALCYEFGWGCWKDPAKAVQFYRQSASKNHPGAMLRLGKACLTGDMGLGNRYREGLKWLKRGTESADFQYNAAPYELGLLHETGFGEDVFRDETYAAQLFTQSADLGHPEASYRMGDAYEHGKLSCPRDPALSVHFYNGAAQHGHPAAMMALCAWYMVGAEPVLDKDENEAYEWARRAAEAGLAKAQYAVGYFTEMGIGCRRDPLEANVWYVKAADQGDERATNRLAVIRAAASGEVILPPNASQTLPGKDKPKKLISTMTGGLNDEKNTRDEKDCIVM